ncbi:MAG: penicillin-binding protein 2 [Methylobacteriaceae bacterium]|jgi:cell division protein FtsI (penicillin-binding protein 3)|nr:penicillin-binding protein 2 [Methylobacteriaceae bacterium]
MEPILTVPAREPPRPRTESSGTGDRGLSGIIAAAFHLHMDKSRTRIGFVMLAFLGVFSAIAAQLVNFAVRADPVGTVRHSASMEIAAVRPNIVDRNGALLATDITVPSLYAEPRNLVDVDEAVELINATFPDLDARELYEKLSSNKGFVWIKREITPEQQAQVHRLGIPGIGFLSEQKRVYPNGPEAAHVLGFANIDNVGIAGMEKFIDSLGLRDLSGAGFTFNPADLKPVQLSLDLRVQHVLRDELQKAISKFKAKAAAGMVYDVTTGEVVALTSLPDFDPNNPVEALRDDRINRICVGTYEMGSTFKALTLAMALDSGRFTINDTFDARNNLQYGRFSIGDYHGTHRVLTMPEVFVHSSNIGVARMAVGVGVEAHKAFLKKMGQLDRMVTELPESAPPQIPSRWGELNSVTISYGHGLAVTPLQAVAAVGALVNGGRLIHPTFLKRSADDAAKDAPQVISDTTSEAMRYVMRLNAVKGSAARAAINGFYVGGKTGSAEKVVNGKYSDSRLFNTFMAIAPADRPKYLFLVTLDEPQGLPETHGYATAGWTAAPVAGAMIERAAPLLGLPPMFEPPVNPFPQIAKLKPWGLETTGSVRVD